jgi:hypothetical protein
MAKDPKKKLSVSIADLEKKMLDGYVKVAAEDAKKPKKYDKNDGIAFPSDDSHLKDD